MKWYEAYPKLPAEEFTWECSGARAGLPPPWREILDARTDEVLGIRGEFGMEQAWRVVGYTFDVPFRPRYDCVAIMFESQADFEKIWWHYPL